MGQREIGHVRDILKWCRLLGELAFIEGTVGDVREQLSVAVKVCDVAPVHLVGSAAEKVVAWRLQPGEHGVDLGFLADEGRERGFLVAPGLLGAELVVRGGDWVQAVGPVISSAERRLLHEHDEYEGVGGNRCTSQVQVSTQAKYHPFA